MSLDVGFIRSKKVCTNCPYFVGVQYGRIAINRKQIRIGFIFWHICITWTSVKSGHQRGR